MHPSLNIGSHRKPSKGRVRRALRRGARLLRVERGFTIVETLVAASVLVVGLLTTFAALDLAVHTSFTTSAREGAVNLTRQITEDVRALPYTSLTSSSAVMTALEAMPFEGSTVSGNTWTLTRRGVTYTVNVTEADESAISQTSLSQKQVTVTLTWSIRGVPHSYSHTATLSSGGQGINLSASALQWANPSNCSSPCTTTAPIITASMGITGMTFSVQTASEVSGVAWELNGVSQSWTSSYTVTNSTTWTWTTTTSWNTTNLADGTYEVGAAAQNGSSTGSYTRIYVRLARGIPSAPSFSVTGYAGYGFNPGLYIAGTKSTVAELDWTGSNNPSVTGNSGDYNVVGYQVTNPAGTVVCKTAVTSQSGLTSTFPGTCVGNANMWCSSPTACVDLSPASTSGTQTYSVAPLYYNSSNVLTVGPSASAAMSGTGSQTYYLATTTSNIGTNCPTGTTQKDFSTTAPAGATATTLASTGSSVTAAFCGPAFTQNTTITTGGTAQVYFTNTSASSCTVNSTLSVDGGLGLFASTSVAANTSTPTLKTFTYSPGASFPVNTGDRLDTTFTWNCGSSLKPVTMYYNSSANKSNLVTNAFPIQAPNAPTTLSTGTAVANSDGTTNLTITWKAPTSGPSVKAYRIYRDGQNYGNRVYVDSASNLCTSGTCTWTDTERSGTHTYYVSAVGNTTAGTNMGESTMAGPTSAQ